MILLAAALLAQTAPADPPPEDVVVVAQRLNKVRWSYHAKNGQLVKCTIKRPSGSGVADAMVCEASRQCAAENPTTGDRHLSPCIKDRVRTLFAAYRANRTPGSASVTP